MKTYELTLTKEVERRYPPGTKFKTLVKGNIYISQGVHRIIDANNNIAVWVEDNPQDMSSATVYLNGTWAEIIELPKIKNYEAY